MDTLRDQTIVETHEGVQLIGKDLNMLKVYSQGISQSMSEVTITTRDMTSGLQKVQSTLEASENEAQAQRVIGMSSYQDMGHKIALLQQAVEAQNNIVDLLSQHLMRASWNQLRIA